MAKKRKAVAYRRLERPYTRYSKYRAKSFVKARPVNKVVSFDMGAESSEYEKEFTLHAKADLQIRDMAIEAARKTSNRLLEKKIGKGGYKLKIIIYPHHMLRENPLAAGAGADRMSTGMKHSFGKVIGIAARVRKGQTVMKLQVKKQHEQFARLALKRASQKFPCSCSIQERILA